MNKIHGYILNGELSAKNAGSCRWGKCTKEGEKEGKVYFIKEFLSPVYPLDSAEISEKILKKRKAACDTFFEAKDRYYSTLSKCQSGNNIVVCKFFRHESRFYVVTDWVEAKGMKLADIVALDRKKKLTLLRAILYSVSVFHEKNIVHSDIRPENLIVKPTIDGYCTAKIIDFDAGFLREDQPAEVQGDFVYLAPESFMRIRNEEGELDQKIDIYALGILFHLYWSGTLPSFPKDYNYVFEALLDGAKVTLDPTIPSDIRALIGKMLRLDPRERPGAASLLAELAGKEETKVKVNTSSGKITSDDVTGKSLHVPGDLD